MIKLIIFDLDDTLYSEKEYVLSGFRAVADYLAEGKKIDGKKVYDALVESLNLNGRGKNFDFIIEKFNLKDVDTETLVMVYREHEPAIKLFPEVAKILKHLREKYNLALLTNGWADVQKKKVQALGLNKYFNTFFYSQEDGLEFCKPHERWFLKTLSHFNLRPAEVLMVGDDLACDIQGAAKLGMRTLHVKDEADLNTLITMY